MPIIATIFNQMDDEKVACVSSGERSNAECDSEGNNNSSNNKSDCQSRSTKQKRPVGSRNSPSPSMLVAETIPEASESEGSASANQHQPKEDSSAGTQSGETIDPIAAAKKDFGRDKENQSVESKDPDYNQIDSRSDKQANSEQCCFECKLSLTKSSHLINVDGRSHKWHPECFKCTICSHQMDRDLSCHIYKDQLLCRNDYKRLKRDQTAAKCARCHWPILALDWVRRADKFVYHLACFSCDICSRQLNTGEQFVIDCLGANGPVRILCRLHFALDPTPTPQSTQRSCYFRKNAPNSRGNANSVSDQPQHLAGGSSAADEAQPNTRKSTSGHYTDDNRSTATIVDSRANVEEDPRRAACYEPSSLGSCSESPISDPPYFHLLSGTNIDEPAQSKLQQHQQQKRQHYSPIDHDEHRAGETRTKRSHQLHPSHHSARSFVNVMPTTPGPASPATQATSIESNQSTSGNSASASKTNNSSESTSLYERRSLNRSLPLVLPSLMSSIHSARRLDQLLNYQLMARDSNESSTTLTNMEDTARNSLEQPEHSSTTNNNHHQHHHHPHHSHHLALASHELNNIGNSNCSTVSNGSNASSTGAQIMSASSNSNQNNDNHNNNNNSNKSKRVRTTFTEDQLIILQTHFQIDSNPDGQDLERIATITGLSKRVTQVWFQNSRARQKKYMTKRKPSGSLVTTAGIN